MTARRTSAYLRDRISNLQSWAKSASDAQRTIDTNLAQAMRLLESCIVSNGALSESDKALFFGYRDEAMSSLSHLTALMRSGGARVNAGFARQIAEANDNYAAQVAIEDGSES